MEYANSKTIKDVRIVEHVSTMILMCKSWIRDKAVSPALW